MSLGRARDYPDIILRRKRSVLPPELQTDIVTLADAMRGRGDLAKPLDAYLSGLRALPAAAIARAAGEIPSIARLYRVTERPRSAWWRPWASPDQPPAELLGLERHPGLGTLLMFHWDGRIREKALQALSDPPQSAFEFAAIAYRLNDWVKQVRAAARDCADRLFPATAPQTIAEAALFLLPQMTVLQRQGEEEMAILDAVFSRPDVVQALADLLSQQIPGHVGRVLSQALRGPGLDDRLPGLARDAALPAVRAIALETLVHGRARWPTGWARQWVDKSFGTSRWVLRYNERPVGHAIDIEALLASAARDRAASVRKVVAQALIDRRNDLSPAMQDVGRALAQDKSAAVRSRADYYLRNLSGS